MPAPRPIYGVSVDQVALTAATTKTVLELRTPTTTGVVPVMWWVEFDNTTAGTPVKVDVGIFNVTTGTTTTAVTPVLLNYGNRGIASQVTAFYNATAEGTSPAMTIGETHRVPNTSGLIIQEALGMELTVGASSFYRIRCTAAAAVNVTFGLRWTE